ncbi:translation initiation factor IF-2 [Spirosoma foliorum]|uniref:Translation initiation factor IF-2 n=1 Tax=Spirosoma foliorum TaxID=2710596 RepID=A0A7G5GMK3_9BACT|nr:translation initiation factor IF-2 [Spirosoma foliorum]QMW00095.1 translation initiation factor IF-2 [Spirosoma foliorum]
MAEEKSMRLSQVAKILNKGLSSVAGSLSAKGFKVEINPNTKINMEQLEVLAKEYKSTELLNGARRAEPPVAVAEPPRSKEEDVVLYRRDDARRPIVENKPESAPAEVPTTAPVESKPIVQTAQTGLPGLKVVGKIDLNAKPAGVTSSVPQAKVTPPQEVKPVETPKPTVAPVTPTPVATETPKPAVVQPPVAPVVKPEVEAVKPVVPAPVAPVEVKPAPVAPVQVAAPAPVETPVVPKEVPAPPVAVVEPKVIETPAPKVEAPKPAVTPEVQKPAARTEAPKPAEVKPKPETPQAKPADNEEEAPTETIRAAGSHQLGGLKILGKIELPVNNPRQGGGNSNADKKKRKRIRGGREGAVGSTAQPGQGGGQQGQGGNNRNDRGPREGDRGPANRTPGDRPQGDRNQTGGNTAPRDGNRQQGQGQGAPREGDRNQAAGNRNNGGGGQNQNANTANRGGGQAGAGNNTNNNNRSGGGGNNANRGGTGQGQNRSGGGNNANRGGGNRREAPTQADVRKAIQQTNARMQGNTPNRGADRRRDRRSQREEDRRLLNEQEELEAKILKVTEFVSANDLASLMDVSINEVISVCLNLGMFVSINQRLDAEAITVIADEFGYDVQFISAEDETEAGIDVEADEPDDLQPRAPIVTIMGHVDHGKTSLLDYIRRAKVAAGEAGGITQHIGAYSVKTSDDRMITFLDTPGHEAFTAMRARGAKVTDVVIIVIAADDSIMPQTREAINHAQVAGVPIVFAFSKVDKPGADAEKIRAELASMNMLVEEWGGKYQAQEISSKSGLGVDDLLEKVLLEAELLELKANPSRRALGTVIEASLDKGRGYVSTVLVENGTLRQGDIMLVGAHYGRIRAMTNDRGERIKEAGPSTPVQILGLPGAPQAGDKFNIMETDREAREIANKREQLLREQTLRTRKHITLEEIGRRKAIGTFKELNVIVKGDVDGSVEALSDSLLQLSTEEVQVNIIHKAVGQISESDVLLASASDAVIVGFQVRPSSSARRLAEQEQIEIRLYSIIYDAINEVRDAMEGLLAPTVEEVIVGNIEVREVFKISKIGTVAGCYVTEGNIKRNNKIRIIRDFIVIHTGEISALKRFKEDVSDVKFGYECGLSIKNFNDIEVGDVIESFELKEVKRTL